MRRPWSNVVTSWLPAALVPTLVYTGATIWLTWPLARVLHTRFLSEDGAPRSDVLLILWILRWDLHALHTDPTNLFNANAFYPLPGSLARSEHLLGLLPLFAPVWWATRNPVLALNLATLLSFVLTGLCMHHLIRGWTGSTVGAYAAGLALAFAPWRVATLPIPHLLQAQWLPLILLGLDRTARSASTSRAIGTAGILCLQCLCSYYLGYMAFVVAGSFLLVELVGRGTGDGARRWGALAIAALAPLAVLVPLSMPYLSARARGELRSEYPVRVLEFFRGAGTPSMVIRVWVGWGTLALALLGSLSLVRDWSRERRRAVRVLSFVLIAAAGFVLAPGPSAWPARWLRALVPGFASMNAPFRFGILASLGVSGLAGMAVARVMESLDRRHASRVRPAVAALVLVGILFPAARTRAQQTWALPMGDAVPAVYSWLAERGEGKPLLELPMASDPAFAGSDAWAMYFSTHHWLPIVNGHTGFSPQSHHFLARYAAELPDAAALDLLADCTGVRWILVHPQFPAREAAWEGFPGIRLVGVFTRADGASDRLYEQTAVPRPGGCRDRLLQTDVTALGHPIPPPSGLHGRLTVTGLREQLVAGDESRVTVFLENQDTLLWPGTSIDPGARATVRARWERTGGGVSSVQELPLPADVDPGARIAFSAWLRHPEEPGRYVLHVAAERGDEGGDAGWTRAISVSAPAHSP